MIFFTEHFLLNKTTVHRGAPPLSPTVSTPAIGCKNSLPDFLDLFIFNKNILTGIFLNLLLFIKYYNYQTNIF